MVSTTRSRSQRLSAVSRGDVSRSESSDEDDQEYLEHSDSEDDDPAVLQSPTNLLYKVDQLPAETRSRVKDAFKDPPELCLEYCRQRDDVYAFQMTELVPRSIRIGSPQSSFSSPQCSCGQRDGPCRHMLWLLDQVTKQTYYQQDPTSPMTMVAEGYAEEAGDPYSLISDFHLDVLADSLHCDVANLDSEDEHRLNPWRVREARELLAAVAGAGPDKYRPDIFSDPRPSQGVEGGGDLERTVFRMLHNDNDFFNRFFSLALPSDPIRDPFRKLEQRVSRVLADLDAFSTSDQSHSAPAGSPALRRETPRNVPWAARHVLGAVALIRTRIFKRDAPLSPLERASAARALVRILASVVARNFDAQSRDEVAAASDRNLYARLIGNAGRGENDFVIGLLVLLPDAAAPFTQDLEGIFEMIGVHGAPTLYADKFARLLASLKKSSAFSSKPASAVTSAERESDNGGSGGASRSGSKRQGGPGGQGAQERGSKRLK